MLNNITSEKRKFLIVYSGAALLFLIFAIVSAIWDLQINQSVYNGKSLFGQFMANVGEFPAYVTFPIAGVILFYNRSKKTKTIDLTLAIVFTLIIGVGYYVFFSWLTSGHKFVSPELMYLGVYRVFFSIVATWLSLVFGSKIDKNLMKKLLWFAIFLIIVMAISNIAVQILKVIWNRQRFRSLDLNTFAGYTPWYKPVIGRDVEADLITLSSNSYNPGDKDAFKSFPSGHTSAAGVSFALIIIPEIFKNLKKYRWIFWTVPVIYTILMGLSRMIVGAHYLSDVTFGGYIAFLTAVLFRGLFIRKVKSLRIDIEEEVQVVT